MRPPVVPGLSLRVHDGTSGIAAHMPRMPSAVLASKVSAQSPPCSRKASPRLASDCVPKMARRTLGLGRTGGRDLVEELVRGKGIRAIGGTERLVLDLAHDPGDALAHLR